MSNTVVLTVILLCFGPWSTGQAEDIALPLESPEAVVEFTDDVDLQKPVEELEEAYERLQPETVGETEGSLKGSSKAQTLQDFVQDLIATRGLDPSEMSIVVPGEGGNRTIDLSLNETSEKGHKRVSCTGRNVTENVTVGVQIVNSTELLTKLTHTNETGGNCAIVMFYAPWCNFCAQTGPHYNALGRAFPQLEVLAIDAIHFSNLNARFGTIAVPNILVFHNAKAVARFNNTMRTLDTMRAFVNNVTGLEGNSSIEVTEEDFVGPLPSVPTQEIDYLLILSWVFVISFSVVMVTKSRSGRQLWHLISNFGVEHHHHHID